MRLKCCPLFPIHLLFFASLCNTVWKVSIFGVFLVFFSHIQTEYWDLLCKSPYSVRIPENTDQKHSEYGQFLRNVIQPYFQIRILVSKGKLFLQLNNSLLGKILLILILKYLRLGFL